ncbi:hypothetical protein BJ912DRAFT_933539 [Pholiota molesta]|nr:hypothetical protein BJ912DRAFT_933539 [Pholiota molesta]
MSSTNSLDRAIELVRTAIDEDTKQNYSEALKNYQNALDYFMIALKYEKNEQSRQLIRAKINEYLSRAEKLKDFLTTQNRGRTTIGVNRSGGATSSTWKSKQDGADKDEGLEIEQPILTGNVNVKRNEAAFLDGAGDDDVAPSRLDGAGDDEVRAADLDGASGGGGDPDAQHLITTDKLNVKLDGVAGLDGAKTSSNESPKPSTVNVQYGNAFSRLPDPNHRMRDHRD